MVLLSRPEIRPGCSRHGTWYTLKLGTNLPPGKERDLLGLILENIVMFSPNNGLSRLSEETWFGSSLIPNLETCDDEGLIEL
ncbi:hypothetical protein CDAR_187741 [Caerostris darwini]|uniref:Uncharacterized protein n=1 Tax=Caerostris darwini TaxID=1538125 RepID=A0AAV4R9P3_9ARAC|nr:hypothetical protein CDAR_187741 [Caerostris darwini]